MSTTAIDRPVEGEQHSEGEANYINASKGLLSWLITLDHKRIGMMYLGAVIAFFSVGGLLALGVRTELWTAEGDLFTGDNYNKVFTLHGHYGVRLHYPIGASSHG